MEKWWFKDEDKKLMLFHIKDDQVIFWEEGPDFPQDISLLRTLCLGIGADLYSIGKSFTKYKKYYINDYHFERVDEKC